MSTPAAPTPAVGRIKPAPTPEVKLPAADVSRATQSKEPTPTTPSALLLSEMTEDEQKVFVALKVGGILWTKDAPIAIIDDQYCKVGDSVKGFKVIDIRKGEVEIQAPSGARRVMPY